MTAHSTISAAVDACRKCDLMIAIGSSLVVQPAASLPQIAKKFGAALFIINRTTTPLDHLADLTLRDQIGQVLPDLVSTDPGSE
jgi:NAD-dependent deacetylase